MGFLSLRHAFGYLRFTGRHAGLRLWQVSHKPEDVDPNRKRCHFVRRALVLQQRLAYGSPDVFRRNMSLQMCLETS